MATRNPGCSIPLFLFSSSPAIQETRWIGRKGSVGGGNDHSSKARGAVEGAPDPIGPVLLRRARRLLTQHPHITSRSASPRRHLISSSFMGLGCISFLFSFGWWFHGCARWILVVRLSPTAQFKFNCSVMQMTFNNHINTNTGERMRKYVYHFSSHAFSRIHLSLKENVYSVRDIKFCMTYAYTIQYAFILLSL
jgi:hypothetical protein